MLIMAAAVDAFNLIKYKTMEKKQREKRAKRIKGKDDRIQ